MTRPKRSRRLRHGVAALAVLACSCADDGTTAPPERREPPAVSTPTSTSSTSIPRPSATSLPDPPCLLDATAVTARIGIEVLPGVAVAGLPHVCAYFVPDAAGQPSATSGFTVNNRVDSTAPQQIDVRFRTRAEWRDEPQLSLGPTGTFSEGTFMSAITMTPAAELQVTVLVQDDRTIAAARDTAWAALRDVVEAMS